MRKLLGILGASLLTVAIAGSAQAIVLQVRGSFALNVAGNLISGGNLTQTFNVTVNGSGGSVGDHLTQFTVPANVFSTVNFLIDVTDPIAAPIEGLLANLANNAGGFAGGSQSGTLAGAMGLSGSTKVCLFADCNAPFVPANLTVPVGPAGVGGATFASSFVNITVIGAPWTTGTVNIGTLTQMGFAHGPASGTTSTAAPSGVISLVTPLFVSTSIPGGTAVVPGFAFLNFHITPEPGTLLLLGSGVVGMALVGRRKMRK